jgi:hypothetical protein
MLRIRSYLTRLQLNLGVRRLHQHHEAEEICETVQSRG